MHLGVSHKNSIACLRARSFPPPPVNVERGRTSRQFLILSAADFPISSWPHSNTCSPPRATSTVMSVTRTSICWPAQALEFQMSFGSAHLDSALGHSTASFVTGRGHPFHSNHFNRYGNVRNAFCMNIDRKLLKFLVGKYSHVVAGGSGCSLLAVAIRFLILPGLRPCGWP